MTEKTNETKKLKVFRKHCTFKGATENDFWYSATRSDGTAINVKFRCGIPDDFKMVPVFYITDIKGSSKYKDVEHDGTVYHNAIYYITSCEFIPVEPEELEV